MSQASAKAGCELYHVQIKSVAEHLSAFREAQDWRPLPSEAVANVIKLAYRHLEDASMRLGKAIQALDGGVSVYDASTTVMK